MDKSSTLNMISVSMKQFTRFVTEQMEFEDYTPVIGIGKSGVGKTESVYGITQQLGIGFCELRLVTMNETDLLGIPDIQERAGRMVTTWASNELLPKSRYDEKTGKWVGIPKEEGGDGVNGILCLDEITSATQTIRAAAYQLLDSKRALGNYHLPEGWLVVALGNGPDDGGVFQGMECAFLSRGRCLRIEPDLKSWKNWAINHEINPTIIAFLSSMPDFLHKFDPDEIASVFPCPRSWASLSRLLNDREKRNGGKPLDGDSIDIYAASCVGADVATTFGAFYSYNKSIISVESIMAGKESTNVANIENEVMYIVVQNLVRELARILKKGKTGTGKFTDETYKVVANTCNWIVGIGKMKLDPAVMAVRDIHESVPEFAEIILTAEFDTYSPQFVQFAVDNEICLQ